MNSKEPTDPVVAAVRKALESNQAITFGPPAEDKEHPQITWQCYGLIATNEIAVIARCQELEIGACQESTLLYPVMAERVFGMDLNDEELAFRMADEIWAQHGERLLTATRKAKN